MQHCAPASLWLDPMVQGEAPLLPPVAGTALRRVQRDFAMAREGRGGLLLHQGLHAMGLVALQCALAVGRHSHLVHSFLSSWADAFSPPRAGADDAGATPSSERVLAADEQQHGAGGGGKASVASAALSPYLVDADAGVDEVTRAGRSVSRGGFLFPVLMRVVAPSHRTAVLDAALDDSAVESALPRNATCSRALRWYAALDGSESASSGGAEDGVARQGAWTLARVLAKERLAAAAAGGDLLRDVTDASFAVQLALQPGWAAQLSTREVSPLLPRGDGSGVST